MNSSLVTTPVIDKVIVGWIAVVFFVICIIIFIYRIQLLLNSDIGGLKSVRII